MKAIEELIKIASIEGIDPRMGKIAREEALRLWVKEYMVELRIEQPIIKDSLTYEDQNFLKDHIANTMADELLEDCIKVDMSGNQLSAFLMAVKR